MNSSTISNSIDRFSGETYLFECLQKNITLTVNNKTIKTGRLILFKRSHFYIQLVILSDKNVTETTEIPIPFAAENYLDEGLLYFDYRVSSLKLEGLSIFCEKIPSFYFNKILEISVEV